jgi:deoxyribose-phosphate aldolase
VEDVRLIKSVVGDTMKVKASGGIRTLEDALAMIEAGADRIGASAGVSIVEAVREARKGEG